MSDINQSVWDLYICHILDYFDFSAEFALLLLYKICNFLVNIDALPTVLVTHNDRLCCHFVLL